MIIASHRVPWTRHPSSPQCCHHVQLEHRINPRKLTLVKYSFLDRDLTKFSPFFTCIYLCVYVYMHSSVQCYPMYRFTELQRNSLRRSLSIHTLNPIFVPWQTFICFHLYSFVISMLHTKWNHTVYNLLGLTYFAIHHALEIHPGCCMY